MRWPRPPLAGEINSPTWQKWLNDVAVKLEAGGVPYAITPSGSPMHIENTTLSDMTIIVNGGTVSQIAYSRDNSTFYPLGVTQGMVWLSPGDWVRITYSAAPSITGVVR